VPEHLDRLSDSLARDTSRRGFLARVGGALMAVTAARTVGTMIEPGESDAFHFCGHTFTTGSCPHPTGLPRIDSRGFPLDASDGHSIDDLGRAVDEAGLPVDEQGEVLRGPRRPAAAARARTRICDRVQSIYGIRTSTTAPGTAAAGKVRKLVDCCSPHNSRINGDAALTGYCYGGRKVFCVQYYDTKVPFDGGGSGGGGPHDRSHRDLLALRLSVIGRSAHGPHGRPPDTLFACAAFVPGAIARRHCDLRFLAVVGGLIHGAGGRDPYLVAAAIAALAAVLEVRGTRIVPQIRRQLPEHWRRAMPMPGRSGALRRSPRHRASPPSSCRSVVWALAGLSLALGDPVLGLVIGAASGLAGRSRSSRSRRWRAPVGDPGERADV